MVVHRRIPRSTVQPAPERTPRAQTDEDAADVRRLDCRRLSDCVDLAARKRWPGFTCVPCPVQDPVDKERLLQIATSSHYSPDDDGEAE